MYHTSSVEIEHFIIEPDIHILIKVYAQSNKVHHNNKNSFKNSSEQQKLFQTKEPTQLPLLFFCLAHVSQNLAQPWSEQDAIWTA